MNTRKAEKNDLDSVFSLICELEEDQIDKSNFCTIYLNNLSDNSIHYVVAEESGKVVGFFDIDKSLTNRAYKLFSEQL